MKTNNFFLQLTVLSINFFLCSVVLFASEPINLSSLPTPSVPNGWKSSNNDVIDNNGRLTIIGNDKSSSWLSEKIPFQARKAYRLRFKASASEGEGSGCLCAGTEFFNLDINALNKGDAPTKDYSVVFFTPDGVENVNNASVRFAQWNSSRIFYVADPRLSAVLPVYKRVDAQKSDNTSTSESLELGTGEEISPSKYEFSALRAFDNTDFDRPLFSTTANFNSDRFCFSKNSTLVYRFSLTPKQIVQTPQNYLVSSLPSIPFHGGSIYISVGYHDSGKVYIEASRNGDVWTQIGEITGVGAENFSLETFFGDEKLDELFIRIRAEEVEVGQGCNLQVHAFRTTLSIDQDNESRFIGRGDTIFADLANDEIETNKDATLWVYNDEGIWTMPSADGKSERLGWDSENLRKLQAPDDADYPVLNVRYIANLKRPIYLTRRIYQYFIQDFTHSILGVRSSEGVDISWCDADYHVPQQPTFCEIQEARPIVIHSAGNDYESFQIVLRPRFGTLNGLTASLTDDLQGEDGLVIPKKEVQLRYAYYHYVSDPTDRTCAPGYYPDALIPLEKGADGFGSPLSIKNSNNLPIWVTIKTPMGTKPGRYNGLVRLTANDGNFVVEVPFTVHVWKFDLPVKNRHETAFGMSPINIWRYHNCQSEEDKRAALEMYLKAFGDYRISPYNPTPMDPIKVTWRPDMTPPSCDLDFSAFDKEIKRVFDKYHFTNFMLDIKGLGGGTFDARYDGEIEGYKASTPEYDAMMTDYGKKLQDHLREIGMLNAAYTYNFDEPEEKDYEFVAGEFAKLKKYIPEVARMLTEEPSPAFEKTLKQFGASIDVWCPVSQNYSHDGSQNQRREGNRFWWYVCTAPKAPYCTEFTDHPAQELRIWHWQAFERNIVGSLVWESTYWTSNTAFGSGYQNPYEDPMCYMSGYGLPQGTKHPWGNGDGRFIYPPLSAAVPGMNDGRPIFDAPNVSIRWEMLRAGIQDCEALHILRNLLTENGIKLSAEKRAEFEKLFDFSEITKDLTHFSHDPQVLLERRLAIGAAIEELQ